MSIYTKSNSLKISEANRIDRIVCAMHADRARTLAQEADAGFPERPVHPVTVIITSRKPGFITRLLAVFR